jgi:cytochrome c oxidase subunit 2
MLDLLIIVSVVLGIIALAQLIKVLELAGKAKGENSWDVTDKDNRTQARLMPVFLVVYFLFIIYQMLAWGKYMLPVSASHHGETIDNLMMTSWIIIFPVFILTHVLLFFFAWKYSYDKNRRAEFFPHSNKLELLWTIVPTVVLSILILYGLNTWNNITTPVADEDNPVLIEVYAFQFGWIARYAGEDRALGNANVRNIEGVNAVGMDSTDANGWDDKIVRGEFHLPVDRPVQFIFRAQDVIHSAYMPHFRAQMNCVPGMTTRFNFIPTITTTEMRGITQNEDFNYILLCNKICGAAHYNMQMDIIVESAEDFEVWLAEQKEFLPMDGKAKASEKATEEVVEEVLDETVTSSIN